VTATKVTVPRGLERTTRTLRLDLWCLERPNLFASPRQCAIGVPSRLAALYSPFMHLADGDWRAETLSSCFLECVLFVERLSQRGSFAWALRSAQDWGPDWLRGLFARGSGVERVCAVARALCALRRSCRCGLSP